MTTPTSGSPFLRAALTILALPVGAAIGYLLWRYVAAAMSTDLYVIPIVMEPTGFGYAAIIVLVAALAASAFVQRDIHKFDLVPVLKSRE